MIGADLQIPRVAHEGKLEQRIEHLARQHLVGGDYLGMPGNFTTETMPGQMADTTADKLRHEQGVPPAIALQGGTDAGPGRLGDMHEQKFIFI